MFVWCTLLFMLGILAFLDSTFTFGEIFRKVNSVLFMLVSLGLLIRTSMKMRLREMETLRERIAQLEMEVRILSEGKLIISNNEKARIAFEEKTIRDYFDMKPGLDEYYKHLSEIAKRGELHVRYL